MDYIFYKSLWACTLLMLIVLYDIACQWSVYLKQRMANLNYTFLVLW